MKWKRITCGEETRCTARGCPIPAGTRHWLVRWKSETAGALEEHYCNECGHGSQAHPGDTRYGIWGSLGLAFIFLVILPALWPHRWTLWLAIFALVYTATVAVTTCLFLRIYPNPPPRESQVF